MGEHEAARTLVKSAPELWDVCSDPGSLGRHLEAFGEIRITRIEPETTVAWEGDRVSGTVRIEPSGWGTRVTLRASSRPAEPVAAAEPEPVAAEPEPVAAEPEPVAADPEPVAPEPKPEPETDPEPVAPPPPRGVFRRLRALFRSFAPPVELPEEAPAGPKRPESAPDEAVPETRPEPGAEPGSSVEPGSDPEPPRAPGSLLTAQVKDAVPGPASRGKSTDVDPALVLETMLNRLGSDQHRPFSRA